MRRAKVISLGHYLPAQIVTNKDLEARMETSDEWIRERTGIHQRHIAARGEFTSDLASKAALAALNKAGMQPEKIQAILVATTTPDETFPATACRVQQKIGASGGMAFDMQAACSGFIYALAVADGLIKSGQIDNALIIGAETYSRLIDWEDRGTAILFGDGAGAVLLEAAENEDRGILHTVLRADGSQADILKTTGGVSTTQTAGLLFMQGREVFRHATTKMGEALLEAAEGAGIAPSQLDWVIPHQANARIIAAIADKFSIPMEKMIQTMNVHANTSAASIPLAWAIAETDGRIKPGNLLALPALGAGLTWGCSIIKR